MHAIINMSTKVSALVNFYYKQTKSIQLKVLDKVPVQGWKSTNSYTYPN